MTNQSAPYVRWHDEEAEGSSGARRVRAAWLVRDVIDRFGERREVLAYLGQRPAVTELLKEELTALYPDVLFDWEAIRRAIEGTGGLTDVATLTDDELALLLPSLAHERGMSLMDLALRLGYRQRQVLPELMTLLGDTRRIARYERTSGSIFEYLADRHPEYAHLLYRARLFFQGDEAALAAAIALEPEGFGDASWRARRRFWREQLDTYRRTRHAPDLPE